MWELICHHEYCWGTIAADRSPWHSDGIASAVSPLPGGQVGLRFSSPQSGIAIPRRPNDPWGHIRALMFEIKARFAQGAGTVLDADNSFRIKLNNQRVIVELPGRTYELADVPLGVWLHFSFSHDGFNTSAGASTLGCSLTEAEVPQEAGAISLETCKASAPRGS